VDNLVKEVGEDLKLGLKSHLMFGIPNDKDEHGNSALAAGNPCEAGVKALKKEFGDDVITITDVCLCAYTSHGHCGFLENGKVVNDPSVEQLAKMALNHARAGVDIVSPSDMMDGRVGAIRNLLDSEGLASPIRPSWPTPRNTPAPTTVPSATPATAPPRATARVTRWTRATVAKRSSKPSWICRKAPTW